MRLSRAANLNPAVYGNALPLGNEQCRTRAARDQLGAWLLGQ
jgi:hypothetical protein